MANVNPNNSLYNLNCKNLPTKLIYQEGVEYTTWVEENLAASLKGRSSRDLLSNELFSKNRSVWLNGIRGVVSAYILNPNAAGSDYSEDLSLPNIYFGKALLNLSASEEIKAYRRHVLTSEKNTFRTPCCSSKNEFLVGRANGLLSFSRIHLGDIRELPDLQMTYSPDNPYSPNDILSKNQSYQKLKAIGAIYTGEKFCVLWGNADGLPLLWEDVKSLRQIVLPRWAASYDFQNIYVGNDEDVPIQEKNMNYPHTTINNVLQEITEVKRKYPEQQRETLKLKLNKEALEL